MSRPDYPTLVKFLVSPFLESPETLRIDCEQFNNQQRVWLRLAIKAEDRGKVYGRGGRNIQAIRSLLQTSASLAGQSLSLEIHEEKSADYEGEKFQRKPRTPRRPPTKSSIN